MSPHKKSKKSQAETHKDLRGYDIKISTFGEIQSNIAIDRVNEFLNEQLDDKKLPKDSSLQEEE